MTSPRVADAIRVADDWRAMKAQAPRSLFDHVDTAIESVADNAGSAWLDETLEIIRTVATELEVLTVDDVNRAGIPETHDLRAMGQAMRAGARRGWIRSTGEYRKSDRQERHHSPVLIWRSRVHATEPPEGGPIYTTSRTHPGETEGAAMK